MKVYRENVKYYIFPVIRYAPVTSTIGNTVSVTMRPVTSLSYKESAVGTLYKLGLNDYVLHDGRWYRCSRVCGVGERFIDLDNYRRLI